MKITCVILILATLLLVTTRTFSQSTYNVQNGENVKVDVISGKVLESTLPSKFTSKYPVNSGPVENSEKSSKFNDDGSMKIPGYIYSGIKEVDEQNYQKAKTLLLQNDPKEFEKWFGSQKSYEKTFVRQKEFDMMPDDKKQQLLANPDRYIIENISVTPDCNK